MSANLVAAMESVGPERVAKLQALLDSAAEIALADRDARCFLYTSLAFALDEPGEDGPCPKLRTAVAKVVEFTGGLGAAYAAVHEELCLTAEEHRDVVVEALASDLVTAGDLWLADVKGALRALERTDFVPEGWT